MSEKMRNESNETTSQPPESAPATLTVECPKSDTDSDNPDLESTPSVDKVEDNEVFKTVNLSQSKFQVSAINKGNNEVGWRRLGTNNQQNNQKPKEQKGSATSAKDFKLSDISPESLERQFAEFSTEEIQHRLKCAEEKRDRLKLDCERIQEEITDLIDTLRDGQLGGLGTTKTERRKKNLELEKEANDNECVKLIGLINDYKKELEARQRSRDSSEGSSLVLLSSLFKEDNLINNVVLYTATFFPYLSIGEFKQVVASLLKGRTRQDKTIEKQITEDGKEKTIERLTQKNLVEDWQESFYRSNQILERCCLEVRKDSALQYIDFSTTFLREEFRQYFETKQPFFAEEMLEQIEYLLFFGDSDRVAEKAASILSEAITYRSEKYDGVWLLNVIQEVKEGIKPALSISRIVELIYKVQLRLSESKSREFLEHFLEGSLLIDVDATFKIIYNLLYRHLYSNSSEIHGSEAIQFLLSWLKRKLNLDAEEDLSTPVFGMLYSLFGQDILWKSDSRNYLYTLLRALEEWLPSLELCVDDYQTSHKISLIILFLYCRDTINLAVGTGEYTNYPLFVSILQNPADSLNVGKLRLLVHWLFYPLVDLSGSEAANSSEEVAITLKRLLQVFDLEIDEPIVLIAFILAEWMFILLEPGDRYELERSQIVDILLEQILLITNREQQRRLNEVWAELSDDYLTQAEEFENNGKTKDRKRCLAKKKIIGELRKRFKAQRNLNL